MAARSYRLSLRELPECHFNWKPESGAPRKLDHVIRDVLSEKLDADPLNKVAYYTLLAYIYSKPETVNYTQAESCLNLADEICQKVRHGQLSSDYLSCQFVIDANRLCIRRERKRNLHELPGKFQELMNRWEHMDDQSKAAVLAVKAIAFFRFGFEKYQESVQSFAEANRLSNGGNYLYLYGEAYILARLHRSRSRFESATDHEVRLWQKAHDLSALAPEEFDRGLFLALYAEATLNNDLSECQALTDSAWAAVKDLPESEMVKRHQVVAKSEKCYRIVRKKLQDKNDPDMATTIDEIQTVWHSVKNCLTRIQDKMPNSKRANQFLLNARSSFEQGKLTECCDLLAKGQTLAEWPGNPFIDCMLIDVKRIMKKGDSFTDEDCLAEYDELDLKYTACRTNRGTILISKAECQLQQGAVTDAMQTMLEAHGLDRTCWYRIEATKLMRMSEVLEKSAPIENFAWFLEHARELIQKEIEREVPEPQQLYETALKENPNNEFALEHLGRLHLAASRHCDAEACFRKLVSQSASDENTKLLAEALLAADCKLKLMESARLGCLDAGQKLLSILMCEKEDMMKEQSRISRVQQQTQKYKDHAYDSLWLRHFTKEIYESCALVQNLIDSSSGYFTKLIPQDGQPENDENEDQRCQSITSLIEQFLEISTSEDGVPGQGNALRKSRFEATKLVISGNDVSSPDFNVEVSKTLKEAKESLDRATTLLPPNTYPSDYFVHGFEGLRKEADITHSRMSKVKGSRGKVNNETRKQTEQNLIDYIMKQDHKELHSSISAYLTGKLTKQFSTDPRTKEIFEFLVSRESAILSAEGPWLVRWIYGANREKHVELQKFEELDERLRTEVKGRGPKTAYEMAHRAAEFAEETRLVMSSWRATDEARETGNAACETSGGNEATGVTDETDDCIGQLFEPSLSE